MCHLYREEQTLLRSHFKVAGVSNKKKTFNMDKNCGNTQHNTPPRQDTRASKEALVHHQLQFSHESADVPTAAEWNWFVTLQVLLFPNYS